MKKFGLIGTGISYSSSKKYFEEKFQQLGLIDHSYAIYDLSNLTEVLELLMRKDISGLNVTQPFKQSIIPLLGGLDESAKSVGAVNTLRNDNGIWTGYNTDTWGFAKALFPEVSKYVHSAIVLGDGGASKAVRFVLQKLGIPFQVFNRTAKPNIKTFAEIRIEDIRKNKLIVQCTPVGTSPKITDCIDIPYEAIGPEHFCFDLVYNPIETEFLKRCAAQKARTKNGLHMLHEQADESWRIWNDSTN